jgi:Zn-dependent protease with chaperone function
MGGGTVVRTSRTKLAVVSLLALVGFYALTLPLAVALILAPIALGVAWLWLITVKHDKSVPVSPWIALMCVASIFAGAMLGWTVLRTRAPRFVAPGKELRERDAPELFALLRELGARVGTAPPDRVYLSAEPNLGVTEVEDTLRRNERVLILGVPLLHLLTREELRAALAHELGHYLGGETRFHKVPSLTSALFRAAILRPPPPRWMHGTSLVGMVSLIHNGIGRVIAAYARLYFGITRSMSRAMEKEADRVAGEAVGRDVIRRSLEKTCVEATLYELYLQRDVARAVNFGGFPSDLHDGFLRYRQRFVAGEEGRVLLDRLRTEPTDPYDTHPALQERLAHLDALASPATTSHDDGRPAVGLLSSDAAEDLLLGTTFAELDPEARTALVRAPWAELPAQAFAPSLRTEAQTFANRLAPVLPPARGPADMLASFAAACKGPRFYDVARAIEPDLVTVDAESLLLVARVVVARALAALLRAALLDQGATLEPFFAENYVVFSYRGERVVPLELTANAVDGVLQATVDLDRLIAMVNEPAC